MTQTQKLDFKLCRLDHLSRPANNINLYRENKHLVEIQKISDKV